MKRTLAYLHYSLIVLLLSLLAAMNFVAYSFNGTITAFLCGTGVDFENETSVEARAESYELAEKICEEGFTLLKNDNNCLPFKGDTNLNVFGWSGCDNGFVYQGFGSGGGSTEGRKSLYSGLREWGISINEDLAAQYNALPYKRQISHGESIGCDIYEAEPSFYTEDLLQECKDFSSRAMIVIGRRLGESTDCPMYQQVNGEKRYDRNYLQLTTEEEYMIQMAEENFEDVIILLNSTNVMETGFLVDAGIDACLSIYAPGNGGTTAVGKILAGDICPSGKTVDTWPYDFSSAATYANAGMNGTHTYTGNGCGGYIDYAENIYEGYYWYETADEEGFFDSVDNTYGKGYKGVVHYPFGYGLSYTTFRWTIDGLSIARDSVLDETSNIEAKVFVENTGSVAGHDVVELYYSAPYYANGIEKPIRKLGAFGKTSLLKPGEGEELTLSLKTRDMASYDCYDKNNNGFVGYELEHGRYQLCFMKDAHTLADTLGGDATISYTVSSDIQFEKDETTGAIVTNRFTNFANSASGATSSYVEPMISDDSVVYSIDGSDAGSEIEYLSRRNFKTTFPQTRENRAASEEMYSKSYMVNSPKVIASDVAPATDSTETSYTLNDMIFQKKDDSGNLVFDESGDPVYDMIDYNDAKWDSLVSQLSVSTMADLCSRGGWGTAAISSINKPWCAHSDGPSGFNTLVSSLKSGAATNFPCETLIASTFNTILSYSFGKAVGAESQAASISGWYGPACDIHRNPFSGRNFEYYSEDPLLSGMMVAYTITGAQEKGLYCFVKHFVVADSEPSREGKYTWLTEQALREVYLKPFEYAVKLGKTTSMMTAYNRIGSVRCSGSYALNTEVLRNEWGFQGCVISDYYAGNQAMDLDEFVRSGNDLRLLPDGKAADFDDLTSATAIQSLHKSTKNILFAYIRTRYISLTSKGLDFSSLIGTKTEVYAWWYWILGGVDALVIGGSATWFVLVLLSSRKKKITA